MKKTISVVIPTYNRIETIQRALDSVLKQSVKVNEIIVIDNCSTDSTAAFIKNTYPQVKVLEQIKQGVSASRNMGILNSMGEWVAFLDSDDEWLPNKIEYQIKAILENPKYKIFHTNETWIRNGDKVNQKKNKKKGGYIFSDCLKKCCVSPSNIIISKVIFKEYGLFNEELPICEDYEYWLRLSANEHFFLLPQVLSIKYEDRKDHLSRVFWGIDRYRVKALEFLQKNIYLSESQKLEAIKIILNKIEIILNGATKRGNKSILFEYKKKYFFWRAVYNKKTGN